MQLEMIMRQIDDLAADLRATSQLIKEDFERRAKLAEEHKGSEKGQPLMPIAMPHAPGWFRDKLQFVRDRLELTIAYLNNQNIG